MLLLIWNFFKKIENVVITSGQWFFQLRSTPYYGGIKRWFWQLIKISELSFSPSIIRGGSWVQSCTVPNLCILYTYNRNKRSLLVINLNKILLALFICNSFNYMYLLFFYFRYLKPWIKGRSHQQALSWKFSIKVFLRGVWSYTMIGWQDCIYLSRSNICKIPIKVLEMEQCKLLMSSILDDIMLRNQ